MRFATREQLEHLRCELYERIEKMEASQQAQIDAITAELGTVQSDIAQAQSTLQAEIDSLNAGQPANLTALQQAADQLGPAVTALGELKPTPPAPPAPGP